jgi:hypothetical protein
MQYEAIYENGQITWLAEKPRLKSARITISILEEIPDQPQKRRHPSPLIAGKGTTLIPRTDLFISVPKIATAIES